MITKEQYDFLVNRTKKREADLQDAIRDALARKAREANEKPVLDLDDLSC